LQAWDERLQWSKEEEKGKEDEELLRDEPI